MGINYVSAENVTDNYTVKSSKRVFIQLFNKKGGDRVAAPVEVWKNGLKLADGETRNENNDTNDMLALSLKKGNDYELRIISEKSELLLRPFAVSGRDDEQIFFYLKE